MAPALLSNGKVVASRASRPTPTCSTPAGSAASATSRRPQRSAAARWTGGCRGRRDDGLPAVSERPGRPPRHRRPAGLHVRWRAGAGGGPPIVAANRVWTVGQDGILYGLDLATGGDPSVGVGRGRRQPLPDARTRRQPHAGRRRKSRGGVPDAVARVASGGAGRRNRARTARNASPGRVSGDRPPSLSR